MSCDCGNNRRRHIHTLNIAVHLDGIRVIGSILYLSRLKKNIHYDVFYIIEATIIEANCDVTHCAIVDETVENSSFCFLSFSIM